MEILKEWCPDAIELSKILLQCQTIEVANTQYMVSDTFRSLAHPCTNQPCHADMVFFGSLSFLVYVTENKNPLMTYFIDPLLMGSDVVNAGFDASYLKAIDYGKALKAKDKALKSAIIQRFNPLFQAENATAFMSSFRQPEYMEGVDEPLENDSYRICVFRPDILHYGPTVTANFENETKRKSLFFLTKKVDNIQGTQYEVQFHPVNLLRLTGPVPRQGKPNLTEEMIQNTFKDYLPRELLDKLEV
jgi:hypothetical protein